MVSITKLLIKKKLNSIKLKDVVRYFDMLDNYAGNQLMILLPSTIFVIYFVIA